MIRRGASSQNASTNNVASVTHDSRNQKGLSQTNSKEASVSRISEYSVAFFMAGSSGQVDGPYRVFEQSPLQLSTLINLSSYRLAAIL